jgi:hypothetical protein
LLGLKYSSSLLDKSYGSKDDWQDTEAVAERMGMLLGKLWSILMGKRQFLAQY